MIDEKGLEAAVASLEPKCRGFCGGSSQLTWNVADELARAAITAYLSTRSAEPVAWMVDSKLGRRFYLCEQKALEPDDRQTPLYTHPKEAPDV